MSAPMSFSLAAKAAQNAAQGTEELEPIEFKITDMQEKEHEFVANFPPEGELLIFMAAQSIDAEDADAAGAMMSLIQSMFPEAQYKLLRKWLRSGDMSTEQLAQVIQGLLERWSGGFPTQPSSDSARRQLPSGASSTGRAPGKGSTRRGSASTAS